MSGRSKTDLGARLRRVLLMIPWLLREGGSTVTDIAARFDVDEVEVVRDLNLIMCCGVPPYGGGDLITVMLDDDGTVEAWPGPFFTKPMQLTPAEGFAVLAAGRALQAVPGTGQTDALASALAKLESALGASGAVAVDLESPTHLAAVQRAAADGERLRITYYSFLRDDLSERVVEPLVVHSRDGRWYVETRDVTTGQARERRLRVDRIQSVESTGERFDLPSPPVTPPERLFSPSPDSVEVILSLPPSARWFVEWMEVEDVEEMADRRLRVRLYMEGDRVLERLLLRVGPDAIIESPSELAGVGRAAAARVLARYTNG